MRQHCFSCLKKNEAIGRQVQEGEATKDEKKVLPNE